MTNSQRLSAVRNRLDRWIAAAGGPGPSESIIRETMLIRDEFYVGRRFYTDSHRAVWFIEEDELKIFNAENELLCVLSSEEISQVAAEIDDSVPDVIKMPQLVESRDEEIRRAA